MEMIANKIDFKQHMAYVQQDDVLMQTMTVKEWFDFAAQMRLPPTVDHKKRVHDLIINLKLEKAQNTKIGGPLVKGVSGGERKRTSIGVELITDPSVIFLDEPTTGLDSFTATTVIEILNDLAESGRTIISTIHQPNSETFQLFDQLMLLADGKTIYMNDSCKAVDYFWDSDLYPICPEHVNPADYFMDMMSIETYEIDAEDEEFLKREKERIEIEYKQKIENLHQYYENSHMKCNPDEMHPEAKSIVNEEIQQYKAGIVKQFTLLSLRSFRGVFRLPEEILNKLFVPIIISIMIILVYGRLDHDLTSIQSRNGCIFFIWIASIFIPIQTVIVIFPDERPVFQKEYSNRMYSSLAYFISRWIADLPNVFLFTVICVNSYYFVVGLNDTHPRIFFIHFFYIMLLNWGANGFGYLFSVLWNQKDMAVNLIPVVVIPFMLTSGFFVNQNNIVPILRPLEYISLFRFSFQVLAPNEYTDLDLDWRPEWDPIKTLDFEENLEESVIATACLSVSYYVIAYLFLYLRSR
jgi:ABC-type multidrug transport system ATPase subunit